MFRTTGIARSQGPLWVSGFSATGKDGGATDGVPAGGESHFP